jgi:hypothetical protein
MEEQVKQEEVKVEVVEEKKKGLSKKVLVIGGGLLALAIGAVALAMKGKKETDENGNQIIDTPYEPVVEETEV